jgi:tetratricopeptide (TPR) repeat protein
VPPFDREAALKAAEKALKLGKVDAAIAEYVKVVEHQPRDWNSANALGDLYVRAKKIERGVEQYTRIADHLADEGFYAKALAIFKKIIASSPITNTRCCNLGDPRRQAGHAGGREAVFMQVADKRKSRGDKKAPPKSRSRLGTLDPEDLESRMRAGKLAVEMGDNATRSANTRMSRPSCRSRGNTPTRSIALQMAYDLDQTDGALRGKALRRAPESNPSAARAFAGSDQLKQVAAMLEKAGRPTRCSMCSRQSPRAILRTSKCAPAWRRATRRAAISRRRAPICRRRRPAPIPRCG